MMSSVIFPIIMVGFFFAPQLFEIWLNDSYEISQADEVRTFKNKNTTIRFTRFNDKREVEYIFVNPAFRK